MIKEGYILVNSKIVKPSYKIKANDEIYVDETFKKEQDINPVKMPLNIVYEDEDIMVINKPSGLVVHPGSGNFNNTLVNGLMYYTSELSDISGSERVGIVHRLDKDTSGLMLVAKTNKAHEILADDFKYKRVKREYYALLIGEFPSDTAFIDAPIGRSKTNFNKMEVRSDGKVAKTHLKVLKRYKGYTLVSLVLETGRTHQIRVHTSYIGYPIYNDPVYTNKKCTDFGQFLHSKNISFTHPITKKEMSYTSELPDEFKKFLDKLEK
jgi:23S rRNA pseudouridine1911/1915/1917 synthase